MLTVQNRSHDPFYNQAFEEYVYQAFPDEDFFFLWQNAPAVVVGSYQNICREVHVEALRRRGIPVVRRMTGGGTVYHDLGNVNYTYILRTNGTMNYDQVLYPVITALNAIGVPARKNRLCDIAIGDQKISGSAQRMTKGRLLHHGTLLFSSDLSVLDQITTHRKNDCFQSGGNTAAGRGLGARLLRSPMRKPAFLPVCPSVPPTEPSGASCLMPRSTAPQWTVSWPPSCSTAPAWIRRDLPPAAASWQAIKRMN